MKLRRGAVAAAVLRLASMATLVGAWRPAAGRSWSGAEFVRLKVREAPVPHTLHWEHGAAHNAFLQTQAAEHSNPWKAPEPLPFVTLYGNITVGSPPQQFSVAIDTNSGSLVVPGKGCTSQACRSRRLYDAEASTTAARVSDKILGERQIRFSRGHVKGLPVQDHLCFGATGNACAAVDLLVAHTMSDDPFREFPFDGVLGLGPQAASLGPGYRYMSRMVEQHALPAGLFSVWLARDGDDEDSEVILGGHDDRRRGSEVLWLPVSTPTAQLWQVKLDDVRLDNVRSAVQDCAEGVCEAAFDTGTSAIAGPPLFVKLLSEELNVKEDCSNFEGLPQIGFKFGKVILNIEPADYVFREEHNSYREQDSCRLLLIKLRGRKPTIILGSPFLKRYYSIFDQAQGGRVGLSLAMHAGVDDVDAERERSMFWEASGVKHGKPVKHGSDGPLEDLEDGTSGVKSVKMEPQEDGSDGSDGPSGVKPVKMEPQEDGSDGSDGPSEEMEPQEDGSDGSDGPSEEKDLWGSVGW